MVPQGIAGYSADLCKLAPYDPARARRELALAARDFGGAIPNESALTLVYQSGGAALVAEYTEIQREWAAVGIHVSLRGEPFNAWLGAVTARSTPLAENLWIADYPDAQDFTHNILSVSGSANITNFSNAQFERLVAQADVAPPGSARTKLYVQAQEIALQQVATIPIGQTIIACRWKATIHGLQLSPGFNYPIPVGNDWTNVSIS
jgi:oligopeptide transport system substrate-binding protein